MAQKRTPTEQEQQRLPTILQFLEALKGDLKLKRIVKACGVIQDVLGNIHTTPGVGERNSHGARAGRRCSCRAMTTRSALRRGRSNTRSTYDIHYIHERHASVE